MCMVLDSLEGVYCSSLYCQAYEESSGNKTYAIMRVIKLNPQLSGCILNFQTEVAIERFHD